MRGVLADTNWFYSTLAQSTAALVGLSGGFAVSQLLARRPELAAERSALLESFTDLRRTWEESAEVAEATARSAREAAKTDGPVPTLCALHGRASFGRPITPEIRESLGSVDDLAQDMAAYYRSTIEDLSEALSSQNHVAEGASQVELPPWLANGPLRRHAGPQLLLPEEEFLDGLGSQEAFARYSLQLADDQRLSFEARLHAFRRRVLPRTLVAFVAVLFAFLMLGLVWPLTFLSASPGPSKPVMLGAFSILSAVVVGLLAYEVRVLRSLALLPLTDDRPA